MTSTLRHLLLSLLLTGACAAWSQTTPSSLEQLLADGQVDAAAAQLATPQALADPALALWRLRVALQRQDYALAQPLVQPLLAAARLSADERALVYAWLFAHDDAAEVDRRSRALLQAGQALAVDFQAAGRLAMDQLQYGLAESHFQAALQAAAVPKERAQALRGLGQLAYKRLAFDKSLHWLQQSAALEPSADTLNALAATLIRLGRTEEAIDAVQRAVARDPYHEEAHYTLGNGYARKNYSELEAAYGARLAQAAALVRRASDAFVAGDYDGMRAHAFAALSLCPEYGRAHNALAKALQFQRFRIDIHRADYERRFDAMPMPEVPGIEKYVLNWSSLSPRHQKRVALSVAPWKGFIPVLLAGGATHFIKPLHMKLSETPGLAALKNQRINTDTRLWDDVRGAGGYATVTGIEDVEKTIFDSYNTVLHELTHQVHGVLTADQAREIQALYRSTKERNAKDGNAFLSRYASGTVWEYFAEGANALASPRRDIYDPREVVLERLQTLDPALMALVQKMQGLTDVRANLPIAYVNAGNDQLEKGHLPQALPFFARAANIAPDDESVQLARLYALALQGKASATAPVAERMARSFPASGAVQTAVAEALWHSGQRLPEVTARLAAQYARVQAQDHYLVDLALGGNYWRLGDTARALEAYGRALAYQSDNPEALWGKAATLALDRDWDAAFALYEQAVRLRPGVAELRNDMARDLIRAGRLDAARSQLEAARLIEPGHPGTAAMVAWLVLQQGDAPQAARLAKAVLQDAPWSDMARITLAGAQFALGQQSAARASLQPLRQRLARNSPPHYVYREAASRWESVQELPAVERQWLAPMLQR